MDFGDLTYADVELGELRRRNFGFHYYGRDRDSLTEIVATRRLGQVVDVVIIRGSGFTDTIGYRAPAMFDVLDPPEVADFYIGDARHTIRWVLILDVPGVWFPGVNGVPFPRNYAIPSERRCPVTIRAPLQHCVPASTKCAT